MLLINIYRTQHLYIITHLLDNGFQIKSYVGISKSTF